MSSDRSPSAEQELARWARSVEFPQPLRWADVESAVLERPAPQIDVPETRRGGALGVAGPAAPLIALLSALLFGGAVIGLGILIASRQGSVEGSDMWVLVATLAFVAALAPPIATLYVWSDTGRRRRWSHLLLTGGNAVVAGVASLVLQDAAPQFRESVLPMLVPGVAVLSLGAFLVIAFASREWRQQVVDREGTTHTEEGRRYNVARALVLESLVKRGIVDAKDVDIPDMLDMPLGSWRELDKNQ